MDMNLPVCYSFYPLLAHISEGILVKIHVHISGVSSLIQFDTTRNTLNCTLTVKLTTLSTVDLSFTTEFSMSRIAVVAVQHEKEGAEHTAQRGLQC